MAHTGRLSRASVMPLWGSSREPGGHKGDGEQDPDVGEAAVARSPPCCTMNQGPHCNSRRVGLPEV